MSSVNLPNGQGISTAPVPFQMQTAMNSYTSPSQAMPETISKPLLKTTNGSSTQYQTNAQMKSTLLDNNPSLTPINQYNVQNSSNDSSRTGSPFPNQNKVWNQMSVNHAHQNSNPALFNSSTQASATNLNANVNSISSNMQGMNSTPVSASHSNVHQPSGSTNLLNDRGIRTSTFNAVPPTNSMRTMQPSPIKSLNGSTHLQNTLSNAPSSVASNIAPAAPNPYDNNLARANGQNVPYPAFVNNVPGSTDKVPLPTSRPPMFQNTTNIKPSYVSFPTPPEQIKQAPNYNQFNNIQTSQQNLYSQPSVQQPNVSGQSSSFMPPVGQQSNRNMMPPLPQTTSVQQNQVLQNVNQYIPKPLVGQTNPGPLSGEQAHVPSINHIQPQRTQLPPNNMTRPQYPTNGQQQPYVNNIKPNVNMNSLNQQLGNMSIVQQGYNSMWGQETVDLMQCRNILPPEKVQAPVIKLHQHFHDAVNCSPDIFRCTMTKIPETNNLLQKSRLPLGVLIHPFRDLNHLPVIQCSTIVRCRACRTYINPFVYFVDSKKWKCNLCYRVNELPEEFQYDPVSKSYGDPSRRPEVKSATIEFIAPSEYMLRPPQPAVYLFLLDTSRIAIESRYLEIVCKEISAHLEDLPGDTRTQVGIICYNSQVHFYSMAEGLTRPHEITVIDINDMFLPCPDNLLVNLNEQKALFKELLSQLPSRFANTHDTGSALGAALQAAYKLIFATGGRVTVFQTCLPNVGPGSLTSREDPNDRSSSQVSHLGPATDFYKRLALDCSGQQIAVDLFLLNSQYADLATLSGISRFSGGCMYHLPLFRADRGVQGEHLTRMLVRYLTRKIGFEAVMRVRCTRGMSIHTFHGNFFVRSTDLLSLPNVNPDAGFGMQLSIDESLQDAQTVCLQAALLYTSSKGERRIRVHTLCLPVCSNLSEVMYAADSQCIVGLLAKMAVDRSLQSSLTDARDAFINVCVDTLGAFRVTQNFPSGYQSQGLCAPEGLKLLPLYIHAVMKHVAFRVGQSTRLDDRIFAMCEMKTLPLDQLIRQIYPDFYPLHYLNEVDSYNLDVEVPALPRMQLTAEKLDSNGVFLMDCGPTMMIYVGGNTSPNFLRSVFGVASISAMQDISYEIPIISTKQNEAVHAFIKTLNDDKPYASILNIIRDNGPHKNFFAEKLVDDRMENSLSYYEFLQHLKSNVK